MSAQARKADDQPPAILVNGKIAAMDVDKEQKEIIVIAQPLSVLDFVVTTMDTSSP
jgi:hypothetical protein